MENFEASKQENDLIFFDDIPAHIERLRTQSETSVADIRTKKRDLDHFIFTLTQLLASLSNNSGSNEAGDDAQEVVLDNEQRGEIAEALRYARSELERLGDKEEELLKKAA
jgi:hypothetical protein